MLVTENSKEKMFYAMSSMENPLWIDEKPIKSRYDKCQDITNEIYKRINITFEINKLETHVTSDGTNEIDSNDLSNGTDLFAYDKTDSLSSSVTLDDCFKPLRKIINLNNNEELKKTTPRRKTKKRFRKRVKKKPLSKIDTDCSSDEEPLSRMVIDIKKRDENANTDTQKHLMYATVASNKKTKCSTKKATKKNKFKKKRSLKILEHQLKYDTDPTSDAEVEMPSEELTKQYEYFANVMENVSDQSDLDAVLMPALYPVVDLHEKKLGPDIDDDVYYKFANLVHKETGTLHTEENVTSASNHIDYSMNPKNGIEISKTDLVKNIPESPIEKLDLDPSVPVEIRLISNEGHIEIQLDSELNDKFDTDNRVVLDGNKNNKTVSLDKKCLADIKSDLKSCEKVNIHLKSLVDLSINSIARSDGFKRQKEIELPQIHEKISQNFEHDKGFSKFKPYLPCHIKKNDNLKRHTSIDNADSKCHTDGGLEPDNSIDSPINLSMDKSDIVQELRDKAIEKEIKEKGQCQFCKLSFSGYRGLRRHLKSHYTISVSELKAENAAVSKEFKCVQCNYSANNELSLRRHASIHNDTKAEKKYSCGECDRKYTKRSTLRTHALTHRGERPHRCNTCQKCFTRYDTWKRHQRVHNRPSATRHESTTTIA